MSAALMGSVTGLLVGLGSSRPASAAQSVVAINSARGPESGGGGSDAQSGPTSGGTSECVNSVPNASFTLTTSEAQEESQGPGTIASGSEPKKATDTELSAYPGGVVDRVLEPSNGDCNVHYIALTWPYQVFVSQGRSVVVA